MKKKDRDEQITVPTAHPKLRLIGFLLALAVAVGAFSYGISSLGDRKEGYYEIETAADEDAPLYSHGFSLVCYLTGSSSEIRDRQQKLKDLYSAVLLRSYKLLDTTSTYDGYANLATLNRSRGQEVAVSQELYDILSDAWEKTREGKGYSLFSGALNAEWNGLLAMTEPETYDPLTDPQEAALLKTLAAQTAAGKFTLEFVDPAAYTVRWNCDDGYVAYLESVEQADVIVDTGLLTDAYRLSMIRAELEKAGYTNGYLTTDSGLTLSLSGHRQANYGLYTLENGEVKQAATVPAAPGSACSFLRTFALTEGELGYYTVASGGETRYRHPNFVTATGDFAEVLLSSAVVREDGDPVEACYRNLLLYQAADRQAVADSAADGGSLTVCLLREDGGSVLRATDSSLVTPAEGMTVRNF